MPSLLKLQPTPAELAAQLGPADVGAVAARIKGLAAETPVLHSCALSSLVTEAAGRRGDVSAPPRIELFFKCENLQKTGSFKYRGALNSILSLSDAQLENGVCATSSGNYAKAMVLAAREIASFRGVPVPVYIVMPNNAMSTKMKMVKSLGGTVVLSEPAWAQRMAALEAVSAETGATLISSETSAATLLGQGTVGPEFDAQVRDAYGSGLDAVVAPCGSGGLLSGLAVALRGLGVQVVGVEPSEGGADDVARGRETQRHVTSVQSSSVADGLRCPVGRLAWELVRRPELVADVLAVADADITAAMRAVFDELKLVVEPSAAVGLAAALFHPRFARCAAPDRPWRVGVVLTGGNVSVGNLLSILG